MNLIKHLKNREVKNILSQTGKSLLVGAIFYIFADSCAENFIAEKNLSPNSFQVGADKFEEQYGMAFLKNKDLDGNGNYETVIRYIGKDGKYHELEMKLDENGLPKVVKK